MNYLVTGGAGFIGSNFVDYLVDQIGDDDKVIILDDFSSGRIENISKSKKVGFIRGTITDNDTVAAIMFSLNPVGVFHFAALPRIQPSFEDPISHHMVNTVGTLNIIDAIVKSNINTKLIFSSTSSVYGDNFPTTLRTPIDPINPYGLQKFASERYITLLCERNNIRYNALRYFNAYGKRSFNKENRHNAYSSVIGIFLDQKKEGKKLTVTGNGSQKRDFIHVKDIARANWCAFNSPNNGVCNIGTGHNISILDLAKIVSDEIEFIPERKGEALETLCSDLDVTEQMINWKPEITFKEGIEKYDTL